jgi:hypothetical protein
LLENDSLALAIITGNLTIQKAAEGTKLNRIKTLLGSENLLSAVVLLISDVVTFFNLPEGKNMNEGQILFCAQSFIEDYPLFSLEDLALCFKQGKKGKYGKNYSTFDGQILMGWVSAYDLDRDEVFVQQNKIEAPKEPIIPSVITQNLYETYVKPIDDEKKFKEDEFKRIKTEWLRKQQQKEKPDAS